MPWAITRPRMAAGMDSAGARWPRNLPWVEYCFKACMWPKVWKVDLSYSTMYNTWKPWSHQKFECTLVICKVGILSGKKIGACTQKDKSEVSPLPFIGTYFGCLDFGNSLEGVELLGLLVDNLEDLSNCAFTKLRTYFEVGSSFVGQRTSTRLERRSCGKLLARRWTCLSLISVWRS